MVIKKNQLLEWAKRKGYRSVRSLRKYTNVSRNTLYDINRGICSPSADVMARLSEDLGIKIEIKKGKVIFK